VSQHEYDIDSHGDCASVVCVQSQCECMRECRNENQNDNETQPSTSQSESEFTDLERATVIVLVF